MVAHRNAHPFEMEMETTRNAFSDLWRKKREFRGKISSVSHFCLYVECEGIFQVIEVWHCNFYFILLNLQHKKLLRNFEGPQKGSKLFLLRWNYLIWYQEMLLMTAIKHFCIGDRENGRCARHCRWQHKKVGIIE